MTVALVLVVPTWLTLAWAAIRLVERSTPPVRRIAPQPPTVHVPVPGPLPEWLTAPGPAAWSAGRMRPTNRIPDVAHFPDPPHPVFRRQTQLTLTASVAAAWDRWEADRPTRPYVMATVVTIHPAAIVIVEQAA